MTAANRIAVEVQRAIGPLFDRRVLESGPFVTPGDHAGVSEGGRSHGRSREQGEAKKCAHGLNRGASYISCRPCPNDPFMQSWR